MFHRKNIKAVAGVLTLALAASVMPAGVSAGAKVSDRPVISLCESIAAATGSAAEPEPTIIPVTEAEEKAFKQILKENREAALKLEGWQSILITQKKLITDTWMIADVMANFLNEDNTGLKYTSMPVGVTGDDLILFTIKKKTLKAYYVYEEVLENDIKPISKLKHVIEVRNSNKDAFEIVIKQKNGKKTSYTTYKLTTKKLKKKNSYSKKGKKYCKNNKKISKKKFKKQEKSFKKLSKAKFIKPDKDNSNPYEETNVSYYSKYLYWYKNWSNVLDALVMSSGENASDPNQYKYFSLVDDDATRYILAPNVSVAGSSTTYQKAQWDLIVSNQMDYSTLPCYYVVENGSSDGHGFKLLGMQVNARRPGPDGNECLVTRYLVSDGETEIYFNVFQDGSLKGKLESYYMVDSDKRLATDAWEFRYNEYATYEGQFIDPSTYARCYGNSGYLSALDMKARALTIHYAGKNPAIKDWTVIAAEDVKFDFPFLSPDDKPKTGFYTNYGGQTRTLPLSPSDGFYDEFDAKLNIENMDKKYITYSTDTGLANSIFWKEA